jgi:glycosyltransferase involved in cell wall biosynthesis
MPVYNGERFLREAVESVLAQTLPDFELIISDNASTDRTPEILQELARSDRRIRILKSTRNLGAAWNYNRVFRASRAPYFRWANADDRFDPRLHEECLRALEEHPDAVLAYGGTVLVDVTGARIDSYDDNLDLRDSSPVRRFTEFLKRVGLTNVIYGLMRAGAMRRGRLMGTGDLPGADVLFMAALVLEGSFLRVPGELFYRRIHDSAHSSRGTDQRAQEEFWSAGQRAIPMPHWRRQVELLRAVARSGVAQRDRARLILFVLRQMYWHRRDLLADLQRS